MENINGLTTKKVIENRKKYGSNSITVTKKHTLLSLMIESLGDPIIKILLIALAIKIVFLFKDFDWFETLGILIAIFLASFISSLSEYGSEKAFNRLQEDSLKTKVKVKRNGKVVELNIDELVKDDIVFLESGDKVPADGLIVSGELTVDESSLNGETKDILKTKNSRIYRGTVVYQGTCIMRISNVGDKTFYGKIASELQEKAEDSPLKVRLRKLAKTISMFGYIGAILASCSYLFNAIIINNGFIVEKIISTVTNFHEMMDYIIYALTLSVTIIIVSVPEGLPMMITLVLSSNMKRMLKNNVLVRKLVGIETAGSINILFSDKTGTLTTGKLMIKSIIDGETNSYVNEKNLENNKNYYDLVRISMVINNMSKYSDEKIIGGNITDRSFLNFFKPCEFNYIKVMKKIPFDSKNKYMITVIDDKNCRNLIKGAPEKIINKCDYYYNKNAKKIVFNNKDKINNIIKEYTIKGSRVLALATSNNLNEKDLKNLCFVGLVVIEDEIRKEAYGGVRIVEESGIQTVMITGDNKDTATYVANKLGILKNKNDLVLTSEELSKLNDEDVKKILPNIKVVARSLPHDKSRLVKLSKESNLVVGMTGDGVNDAPALKKADVGFAFGSGSEVAKEAGDIVILDDNFMSISKAILFGRTIFKSIRKFIVFQLTINLCALGISIIGPFIGVKTPVTVMQMLWINMVMDTLAGLAFSFEPPLDEYMKEKPKRKNENIMNNYMINEVTIMSFFMIFLLIFFLKSKMIRKYFLNRQSLMTGFFCLFIFSAMFNSFNARTTRINILSNLIKNKIFIFIVSLVIIIQVIFIYYGGNLFRTVPLNIKELLLVIIISSVVIPIDVLRKLIYKEKNKL